MSHNDLCLAIKSDNSIGNINFDGISERSCDHNVENAINLHSYCIRLNVSGMRKMEMTF